MGSHMGGVRRCFNFFSLSRLTYFGRRPFFSSFVPGVWQGNMEKIKSWAVSLQDVLVQMAKQMQVGRTHKSHVHSSIS